MRSEDRRDNRTAVLEATDVTNHGVFIGAFQGFDADGRFLVDTGHTATPMPAMSIVSLTDGDIGARVVVSHDDGDIRRPIILGLVQEKRSSKPPYVAADGERVVIAAEREIELRCGQASIVLTRAGKVLIRGNYVLSRSRGANKVKGAVVDIN